MADTGERAQLALSEETVDLMMRLGPVIEAMRATGKFNFEQFVRSCEAGMGGTLTVRAPSKAMRGAKDIPECSYRTEDIPE